MHLDRRQTVVVVCLVLWSILSFLVISRFLFRASFVVGDSMSPTLEDGERMLVNRMAYRMGTPSPGDVVAIQLPDEKGLIVKRIIAGPGETVQFIDGVVLVNGRIPREPYLPARLVTGPGMLSTNVYVVQPGCYFVLGDNRPVSYDSRFFGAVRSDYIAGRVTGLWRAWLDVIGL